MNSAGVISTITALDYLFVPMKADRMILESTLNFATTINDRLITTGQSNIKGLYLFWNLVDRRERNRLFDIYEKGINQLGGKNDMTPAERLIPSVRPQSVR